MLKHLSTKRWVYASIHTHNLRRKRKLHLSFIGVLHKSPNHDIFFIILNQLLKIEESYQHSGSEIELLEELCDEDVNADEIICVIVLYISNDVGEPFVMLLGTGHPDEIHLKK